MSYDAFCLAHPLSEYVRKDDPSIEDVLKFDGDLRIQWMGKFEDRRHRAWEIAEGRWPEEETPLSRLLATAPYRHDEDWERQPDYSIHAPWNRE